MIRPHGPRTWVLDWRHHGRRRRRWFHDEHQARRAAAALNPTVGPPPRANRRLDKALADYLSTCAGCCKDTFRHHRETVAALRDHLGPFPLDGLQPQHFTALRQAIAGHAPNTRREKETRIRRCLKYLHAQGYTPLTCNELFPRTPIPLQLRSDTATERQLAAIINAAPPRTRPTVELIAMLGRETGCRISETARAQARDWCPPLLTIRSSKRSPPRICPANPTLHAYLDALIPADTAARTALTAITNGKPLSAHHLQALWREAATRAHQPVTTHDLRRTWASEHAEHAPLPILMALAGWRTATSALHYIHLAAPAAKARAVARAWNARQHPQADTLDRRQPGERKDTVQ